MRPYGSDSSRMARADVAAPDVADALHYGAPSRVYKMTSKSRKAGRRHLHKAGRRAAKRELQAE